ncbi:hypothetical protein N4Q73_23960 [Salmonella enterica subsp. enterica serovar Pomona]
MKLRETVNARLSEWRKGCRLIWHEWLILFLVICILVAVGMAEGLPADMA